MRAVGLHLSALLPPHPSRPSALARVDEAGRLTDVVDLATDADVLAAVPRDSLLAVDTPLDIPNETGNREIERIVAWCDVPLFPVAGARLDKVLGGRRGVSIAPALRERALRVVEVSPELVLRQILFEESGGISPPDLAEYRGRWLSIRPPVYRPKGAARAKPAGLEPTARLLGSVLELGDFRLTTDPDDLEAIADAARLDAIASAYAAHRALADPAAVVLLGAQGRGEMLIPTDPNLRNRLEINLARMAAGGEVDGAVALRNDLG